MMIDDRDANLQTKEEVNVLGLSFCLKMVDLSFVYFEPGSS
jgi:hypothetical protein